MVCLPVIIQLPDHASFEPTQLDLSPEGAERDHTTVRGVARSRSEPSSFTAFALNKSSSSLLLLLHDITVQ